MGFNIGWIALRDMEVEQVLALIDASFGTDVAKTPDFAVSVAALPQRWSILFFNDLDVAQKTMKEIGDKTTAPYIVVTASEGAMTSYSAAYDTAGQQSWSCFYPVKANWRDVVETGGQLPAEFNTLVNAAYSKQYPRETNDYEVAYLWDVPIELAKAVTGFRHDEMLVRGEPTEWKPVIFAPV